jgi:hypothetical protein
VTIPKRISVEAMTKQVRSERKIPCQRTFAKDLDALRELSYVVIICLLLLC